MQRPSEAVCDVQFPFDSSSPSPVFSSLSKQSRSQAGGKGKLLSWGGGDPEQGIPGSSGMRRACSRPGDGGARGVRCQSGWGEWC